LTDNENIERELKFKEIIATTATTVLSLYVVMLTFLGKALFVLTLLGFWLVFLPVWFLALSAILSISSLIYNRKIQIKIILVFYSIGVAAIPIALTIIYSFPLLFWGF